MLEALVFVGLKTFLGQVKKKTHFIVYSQRHKFWYLVLAGGAKILVYLTGQVYSSFENYKFKKLMLE